MNARWILQIYKYIDDVQIAYQWKLAPQLMESNHLLLGTLFYFCDGSQFLLCVVVIPISVEVSECFFPGFWHIGAVALEVALFATLEAY